MHRLGLVLALPFLTCACSEAPDVVALRATDTFTKIPEAVSDRCSRDAAYITKLFEDPDFKEFSSSHRPPWEKKLSAMTTHAAAETVINGDKAVVSVVARYPAGVFEIPDAKRLEFLSGTPPIKEERREVKLEKENGRWVVCSDLQKAAEQRKAEADAERVTKIRADAAEKGFALSGVTPDEIAESFCSALAAELPTRGSMRDTQILLNKTLYGCSDPGPAVLPPHGHWSVRKQERLIDGTSDVFLSLAAGDAGVRDETLFVRCIKGKLDAYFTTRHYVGDEQSIAFRIDDKPIGKWWMSRATDGGALFFSKPKEFLKQMKNAKRVVVEYKPYSKSSQEAVFDVVGSEAALAKLDGCSPL